MANSRCFSGLVLASWVAFLWVLSPWSVAQGGVAVDETLSHIQRGQAYFQEGFFDHAPRGRAVEAYRNLGLAAGEFRAAIEHEPGNLTANRALARVYYLQGDFPAALRQYQRVTELAPLDLDAYVHQSLALIEMKQLDAAIQALESAKRATLDGRVLETLDGYIARIRARQRDEVR